MSPRSIVESVSEGLTRGFANQPLLLALVLLNAVFMAAVFFSLRTERNARHAEMQIILERCLPGARDAN